MISSNSFGGRSDLPFRGFDRTYPFWIPADGTDWPPDPLWSGLSDIVGGVERMTYFYDARDAGGAEVVRRTAALLGLPLNTA